MGFASIVASVVYNMHTKAASLLCAFSTCILT